MLTCACAESLLEVEVKLACVLLWCVALPGAVMRPRQRPSGTRKGGGGVAVGVAAAVATALAAEKEGGGAAEGIPPPSTRRARAQAAARGGL